MIFQCDPCPRGAGLSLVRIVYPLLLKVVLKIDFITFMSKATFWFSSITNIVCNAVSKYYVHVGHVCMNSMRLVIPLDSLYWSIHTKDESKRGTAFAFIFGVNWLWRCGVTASFGVFFHEKRCNGMTSFMEFMIGSWHQLKKLPCFINQLWRW